MDTNKHEFFPLMLVLVLVIGLANAAASPTPFDVSKVDLSKISEEEIQKTIAHRNELQQKQITHLENASEDTKLAAQHTKELQNKIDALALQAAKDHDAVLEQKAAILRRDIAIGILALTNAVTAFLAVKFSGIGSFL